MFLARRRSGKESANVWVNVYMESDHSHTASRIRMPQPQAAYAYRVYGILALRLAGAIRVVVALSI